MSEPIAVQLSGGDPRSLGRTPEVVARVLAKASRLAELFDCLFHDDEVVRMRAGDALEKVCRHRPQLLEPYVERILDAAAATSQPSVQWHLAQIIGQVRLSRSEHARAVVLLQRYLTESPDWIVLTSSMTALAALATTDPAVCGWLSGVLRTYADGDRYAVATRARKLLADLAAAGLA